LSKESLLVFSIGPVQRFIAAARKIEDLWSGSYLLSYLTERAIETVREAANHRGIRCEIVYPSVNPNGPKPTSEQNIEVASLPNRFLCTLEADQLQAAEIAREAERTVIDSLIEMGQFALNRVFPPEADHASMTELLNRQVKALLEVFWATESLRKNEDFVRARTQLGKRLAAIKNCRPYRLNAQEGLVCTLCGEQQALTSTSRQPANQDNYAQMKKNLEENWSKRGEQFQTPKVSEGDKKVGRIKDGEGLCGICLTKRLARDYFKQKREAKHAFAAFPSTHEISGGTKYYAVIMMDGDDMGKWISGANNIVSETGSTKADVNIEYQKALSAKLDNFAVKTVPNIVLTKDSGKQAAGKLIYAGGDDVLAFAPVNSALGIAKNLRLAFSNDATGLNARATASTGIVIAHEKAPLHMVLEYARKMEGRAKAYQYPEGKAKDALGLAVLTHSGEIREVVLPWAIDGKEYTGADENCSVSYLQTLIKMVQEQLSVSFMEHFAQAFLPLLGAALKRNKKISVFPDDPSKNRRLLELEMTRVLRRSARDECHDLDFSLQAHQLIKIHELMSSTLQFVHLLEMSRFFKRMEGKK